MSPHGTIALAQIDPKLGDLASNLDLHRQKIEEAIAAGAGIVVFPELSLTGYTLRDLTGEVALDPRTDPRLQPLRDLSRTIGIAFGCVEAGTDHGLYNSAIYLEDGAVRHIHRKVYLPTYGMFEEGRHFSSGHVVHAFESKFGRIGMLVCEDLWHVSLPYLLATDGAELMISLTASPARLGGESDGMDQRQVNHEHHRVYARLLSLYSVFVNRVGIEDGVSFWGGSAVFSPSGRVVAEARDYSEQLLLADLRSTEVRRARRSSRHVLDERPDVLLQNLERIRRR